MILQVRIVLAQIVAADDAPLGKQVVVDRLDRLRAAYNEFLEERLLTHYLEAIQGSNAAGGIVGLVIAKLGQFAHACRAQRGKVH